MGQICSFKGMLLQKSYGIILLVVFTINIAFAQKITRYEKTIAWGTVKRDKEQIIVLRQFQKAGHQYYFTVSPITLITSMKRADSVNLNSASWEAIRAKFSNSAYIIALKQSEAKSNNLQDAGFTRFSPKQQGIDLTIDLCPSHRPLDRDVFTDLINELGNTEKPVPVAISITGRWMSMHPRDLNWLDSLRKAGALDITWINHTFNHQVSRQAPLKQNFLLEPGTDITSEVLNTEVALLERNILPSVFFRFPGLVSDKAVFDEILNFGLIPVGSDAWLAKGQWPKEGSIVLIHANGNEPIGIRDFIELLTRERASVLSKQWELYDLRESLIEDESK